MADVKPVAVIVLTWNGLEYSRRCLEQLRTYTRHPSWRVIVVDNGSTDGTVEWLKTLDWITLVCNDRNLGFTKGNNIGLAQTRADEDVLLLNNDIMVDDPEWLTKLQDVAYADPRNGLVGCRLYDPSGLINHLGSYIRPVSLYGEQMGGQERDIGQATSVREVECTVFAVTYIRRDCLDKVGPLDEDYFSYLEDTDYCFRAKVAGYRTMYAGNVNLLHHHNTSTRVNKVDIWSLLDKSRKTFQHKWGKYLEHDRYDTQTLFRGPGRNLMSMSVHSQAMVLAMHNAGIKVHWENGYGDIDQVSDDPLFADIQSRKIRRDIPSVSYTYAHTWLHAPAAPRRIGWSMLEVTGLPSDWVAGANSMDEVWVPSAFNAETFRRAGVTKPIHVVPLGVDTNYFHPQIASFRPSDRFTFLAVFEWGERKDPERLLRAFAAEFKPDDDVALVCQIHSFDPQVDVSTEIAKLELPDSAPIVIMLNPEFNGYQMGALYRSADCFVSTTHGEGWGMPQLEAMACGLPVITTGWSAYTDFLNAGNAYPLDYKLIPAVARCPYYEGWEWAEADFDHLRSTMRHVADNRAEARAKGMRAAAEVAEKWTWEHAAQKALTRLKA